jgi:predicted RNase H-like nuclease
MPQSRLDNSWIAGADGCKGLWFRVALNLISRDIDFQLLPSINALLESDPRPGILAIDVPIGLPEGGPRNCDKVARKLLGRPRDSSVFRAPVRPSLFAGTREIASALTQAADGCRVGCQAWGIYPKVREVDEYLQTHRRDRRAVYEVHPEVCFWAWNGRSPMKFSKKKAGGKLERMRLVNAFLGEEILLKARGQHLRKTLADDDVMDAIAALWTAERIANGAASRIPPSPEFDATGLEMTIWY